MSSFAVVNHESDFSMHTKSVFVHVHTRKFAGAHVCVFLLISTVLNLNFMVMTIEPNDWFSMQLRKMQC